MPITGEKALLAALQTASTSPDCFETFLYMTDLYREEFGPEWLKKEMEEARENIKVTKMANRKLKGVPGAVEALFKLSSPGNSSRWIGTRQVSPADYSVYAKGLYWMAGYLLIRG